MKAKAMETTLNLKRGAKRVIDSQDVKEKGIDLMKSTKELVGAIYSATRGNDSRTRLGQGKQDGKSI